MGAWGSFKGPTQRRSNLIQGAILDPTQQFVVEHKGLVAPPAGAPARRVQDLAAVCGCEVVRAGGV